MAIRREYRTNGELSCGHIVYMNNDGAVGLAGSDDDPVGVVLGHVNSAPGDRV